MLRVLHLLLHEAPSSTCSRTWINNETMNQLFVGYCIPETLDRFKRTHDTPPALVQILTGRKSFRPSVVPSAYMCWSIHSCVTTIHIYCFALYNFSTETCYGMKSFVKWRVLHMLPNSRYAAFVWQLQEKESLTSTHDARIYNNAWCAFITC